MVLWNHCTTAVLMNLLFHTGDHCTNEISASEQYKKRNTSCLMPVCWGGSRGGSVEPPKLNVKTYNKRVVIRLDYCQY